MNPQQPTSAPQQQVSQVQPKNNAQQGIRFITRWVIKGITVTGKENYTKFPKDAIVIFAAAALQADIEVFCAAQGISDDWHVVVASHTVAQTILEQGFLTIARFIAGRDTFYSLPVSTAQGDLSFSHPEVFTAMLQPIKEGKAVVMTASKYTKDGILQKEPTIEPVYLAQIAQDAFPQRPVVIVPVVTQFQVVGKQRSATVTIGTPIQIARVDAKAITTVLQKKPTERTPQDYDIVKQNALKLRQQGSYVMQAIAALLPVEKRGIWGQAPQTVITQ